MSLMEQKIAERIFQAECEVIRLESVIEHYQGAMKSALNRNDELSYKYIKQLYLLDKDRCDSLQQEIHDAKKGLI